MVKENEKHEKVCHVRIAWNVDITTAENHNRYITDANKIIKLSRDFEEAKAIVDYNWHGFDDVEIIQK